MSCCRRPPPGLNPQDCFILASEKRLSELHSSLAVAHTQEVGGDAILSSQNLLQRPGPLYNRMLYLRVSQFHLSKIPWGEGGWGGV